MLDLGAIHYPFSSAIIFKVRKFIAQFAAVHTNQFTLVISTYAGAASRRAQR